MYAVQRGALIDWFTYSGRLDETAGWGWTLLGDDGYRYRYMHLDALEPTLAARFADVANDLLPLALITLGLVTLALLRFRRTLD